MRIHKKSLLKNGVSDRQIFTNYKGILSEGRKSWSWYVAFLWFMSESGWQTTQLKIETEMETKNVSGGAVYGTAHV